jgi:hypothetical protein
MHQAKHYKHGQLETAPSLHAGEHDEEEGTGGEEQEEEEEEEEELDLEADSDGECQPSMKTRVNSPASLPDSVAT